jgi:immune inhibitor A
MGPREKLELGFIRSDEVTTFDPSDVNTVVGQTHTVFLGQSTYPNDRNYDRILKINLPDYKSTVVLAKPSSGSKQAYAGRADKLTATMRQEIDLTSVSAAVLEFMTYYEIEKDYDYGYVEVSTDSGKTFATLPGTVAGKPTQSSAQLGNYITGMMVEPAPALKTMQPASYDLTAYAGKKVLLQFRYGTDEGYTEIGWFVDDVRVTGKTASGAAVAIFSDDFETGNQWATAAINWQTSGDTKVSNFRRYLLAEWRHHNGFNEGLKSVYNTVNGVGQQERLEYHSYEEGLLVWYVNEFYGDNNVTRFSGDLSSGIKYDAGEGYALVVDAHPKSMLQTGGKDGGVALDGLPFRTRVQAYDAPFSLTPASALKLSLAGFDFTSPSYEADSAWTSAQKPGNQELSLGCEPDDAAQYFTKPMATNKVSQFHGVKLPADANVKLRIREVTADDTAVAVDVVRCK